MRTRHWVWLAIPVVAFFIAPYLPFVDTSTLWLGLPAPLVWALIWTVGTTAAMWCVERSVHGRGATAGATDPSRAEEGDGE